MPPIGLFKLATDVVVVSVGVVSTSESCSRDFSRCKPILSFSFEIEELRRQIDYNKNFPQSSFNKQ